MPDAGTLLTYAGYISDAVVVASVIGALVLWLRGIVPVLIRLGNGLSRRKIVIFAKGDTLRSLETLLYGSKLFSRSNISVVTADGDIRGCEGSVFLVHWPDWSEGIEKILNEKKKNTAVVIYTPPGSIPNDVMAKLGGERNVAVCNFRGRLLNDLVTAMITTSYEKK